MAPSRRIIRSWPTTGEITAPTPSTSERLAALDPMTFPTAEANSPLAAAKPLTTNSGADVPNPMTNAPTRTGETPQMRARRAAASMKGSAATQSNAIPAMISISPSQIIRVA